MFSGESKGKSVGGEAGSGLDSLGSKLSLLAWVDTFRIDIVVGELARDRRHQTSKGKGMTGFINFLVFLLIKMVSELSTFVDNISHLRRV